MDEVSLVDSELLAGVETELEDLLVFVLVSSFFFLLFCLSLSASAAAAAAAASASCRSFSCSSNNLSASCRAFSSACKVIRFVRTYPWKNPQRKPKFFLAEMGLTLKAPIATKVVCFSCLLKCLRSLYGKQCGPRSDCSYRSSLFWVHAVCFYT